jgi:tetratricopeptide (TPR) repeat protein
MRAVSTTTYCNTFATNAFFDFEPMPDRAFSEEDTRALVEARALMELGRHRQAVRTLERILAESPEDSDALLELTYAYLNLGELDRALSCADRVIAVSPETGEGFRYRASILIQQGRMEEALSAAEVAVELSPEDGWNLYFLAEAQMKSFRISEAKETARRLLALMPEWSGSHDTLGRIAIQEGRYDEAEAHCKKALEIDPESSVAMNNLGAAFLEGRKYGEAVKFFWNALKSRPESRPLKENLQRALAKYFSRGLFLWAWVLPPLVLLVGLKAGVIPEEDRTFHIFWGYYIILACIWVTLQFLKHRLLPESVRNYIRRVVHEPFWRGLRDIVVFCGVISSFFHAIYLYMWWSGGSTYGPQSAFTWRLFVAFSFWIVTCYAYLFSEWIRKRRRLR